MEEAEIPETLIAEEEEAEEGRFFACYLLSSRSPRYKGHTYIGFTVNPRRRIRQHNGEIAQGAWRTKRKRPWEMVLCIYGFPTNVSALQFEWAWQHPIVSKAVRQAAASFKSLRGLVSKIKLAYTMLTLPPWQRYHLIIFLMSGFMKGNEAMNSSTLPEETLLNFRTHNSADDQQSDSGNRMNEVYGCKGTIDIGLCGSSDDMSVDLGRPAREQLRAIVADDDQSPSRSYLRHCGAEVIDLTTPAPL
ncbi:hypothetical protein ACE6H2_000997 [Prunus campanulata]